MSGLPRFIAALVGLSVLAFGFGGLIAESKFGRPSSTSSIGLVFVPIVAILASAVAYTIGMAVRALLVRVYRRGAGLAKAASPRWQLPVAVALLVLIPAMFGVSAAWTVVRHEAAAEPRVLETTAGVVRAERAAPPAPDSAAVEGVEGSRRYASTIYEPYDTTAAAGRPAHLPEPVLDGMSVSFARGGQLSRTLQLPGLDYVTSIDAIALMREGEVAAYAYAINGRATGRRTLVVLLSDSLEVLHAELVMRPRRGQLCAAPADGLGVAEIAVMGCGSTTELTLQLAEPLLPLAPG